MMKDNGGSAFPHGVEERNYDVYGDLKQSEYTDAGMTLRDYFAAKAMNAFVANPNILKTALRADVVAVAEQAYKFADAMIEARKK